MHDPYFLVREIERQLTKPLFTNATVADNKTNSLTTKSLFVTVDKAHREFFNLITNNTKNHFSLQLTAVSLLSGSSMEALGNSFKPKPFRKINGTIGSNDSTGEGYNHPWKETLNTAVKTGIPADFSDEKSLRVYAYDRLVTRVRYLHHLVMDNNRWSEGIRKLLVPRKGGAMDGEGGMKRRVRVCAIGDGPGYDGMAFEIVKHFLHQIHCPSVFDQHEDSGRSAKYMEELQPAPIETISFDLFDKEWSPVKETLNDCFKISLSEAGILEEDDSSSALSNTKSEERNTIATDKANLYHCDIRLGLDDPANSYLKEVLPDANILTFQYVLHENSSTILPVRYRNQHNSCSKDSTERKIKEKDGAHTTRKGPPVPSLIDDKDDDIDDDGDEVENTDEDIGGLVGGVLRKSSIGTFIVCTDSNNFVWPTLKATASRYGWTYVGDSEWGGGIRNGGTGRRLKGTTDEIACGTIAFGPKSFVVLERVSTSMVGSADS